MQTNTQILILPIPNLPISGLNLILKDQCLHWPALFWMHVYFIEVESYDAIYINLIPSCTFSSARNANYKLQLHECGPYAHTHTHTQLQ